MSVFRIFRGRVLPVCLALALVIALAPAVLAAGRYKDVPGDYWAVNEIEKASDYGLFAGYPDGTFGLGKSITRQEFAVVLCRLFGWDAVTAGTPAFSDCTKGYYRPYVDAIAAQGAVETGGTFRPTAAITRGEMAQMLVRGLGFDSMAAAAAKEDNPFTDVPAGSSLGGYILAAYHLGIINGYPDGTFRPNGTATREECAAMLIRVYDRYNSSLEYLHGFYALSSYKNIALTADMDGVSVGWSRLEVDSAAGPYLLTTKENGNEWAVPQDSYLATDYFAAHDTSCHLNVFTSTFDALTLADGTATSDLAAVLSDESWWAAAVAAIVSGAADYDGVTIDFEGLKDVDGLKENFVAFLQDLRSALPEGKGLFVCVSDDTWYTGYDYRAIGEVADKVIVMAHDYDFTSIPEYYVGRDALANENPSAGLTDVYSTLVAVTDPDTGVKDKSKLVLAVSIDSSGYQVDEEGKIASTTHYHPTPSTLIGRLRQEDTVMGWSEKEHVPYINYSTEDGSRYTIWYEDERSITEKIKLARMFGIDGLSVWYVGSVPTYEDQGLFYNVWEAVLEQVQE